MAQPISPMSDPGAEETRRPRVSDPSSFLYGQRERTLRAVVWITLAATLTLILVDVVVHDAESLVSLAIFGAALWPVHWLNRRGHLQLAGILLFTLLLAVSGYNMIVDSDGLHDAAVVGFPVFVVAGALVLGKRALPWLTLAGVAVLTLVASLEFGGMLSSPHPATGEDLLTMIVLMASGALITWIAMDYLEKSVDRVRLSEAKVRRAYDQTLEAWARALEYRDSETEGHSRRVVDLTMRLGRELGCSDDHLLRLRWGALLHDIGKLAVPDRILLKPGELTAEETELMQQHPVYAREMLSGIDFLHPAMSIPCHHHERWDGQGYPDGLSGEEIPLAARIFTVVDQWEALCSDRPYREAWPTERIVAYMKDNAGKIFDADILQVFFDRVLPDVHAADAPGRPARPNDAGRPCPSGAE